MAQAPYLRNLTTNEPIPFPAFDELREIYHENRGAGIFAVNNPIPAQTGQLDDVPHLAPEIAATLYTWGRDHGLDLSLGVLTPDGDHRRILFTPRADGAIWIWNPGNRWEGVSPAPPPPSTGDGGDGARNDNPPGPPGPPRPVQPGSSGAPSAPNLQLLPVQPIPPPSAAAYPPFAAAFDASFPGGAAQIPNNARMGQCGLLSILDSLRGQLGQNPTTAAGAPIFLPTYNALLQRYRTMRTNGAFQAINQLINAQANQDPNAGPFQVEEIAMVLRDWGLQHGLLLDLGAALPNGQHYVVQQPVPGTQTIWIYNPGATWRGVEPDPRFGQAQYDLRFPNGHWTRNQQDIALDQRSIVVIRAGMYTQFPARDIPGGEPPSIRDVLLAHQRWQANGRDPAAAAASNNPATFTPSALGPVTPEELAGTLFTWARTVGMSLNLGVITEGGATAPYIIHSGMANPRTLWVASADNNWEPVGAFRRPATPVGSDESLPDYESSDDEH